VPRYFPKKGDFVTISFDPQAGHEQKGRRPALVLSNDLFTRHTGLAIVCPVTNTDRGYPFHVPVPSPSKVTGFVMVEQVKSMDFAMRHAKLIEPAPTELVEDVLDLLDVCLH
jgi:mRNA interferase MazF